MTRTDLMVRARAHVVPLVTFGIVGVANTAVYYGAYLLLHLKIPIYLVAHLFAWAIAVVFSYFANSRFTYRRPASWRSFLLYPITSIPNLVFSTVGIILFVEVLSINQTIAPLLAGLVAVPFSYALGRVAFRPRTVSPKNTE